MGELWPPGMHWSTCVGNKAHSGPRVLSAAALPAAPVSFSCKATAAENRIPNAIMQAAETQQLNSQSRPVSHEKVKASIGTDEDSETWSRASECPPRPRDGRGAFPGQAWLCPSSCLKQPACLWPKPRENAPGAPKGVPRLLRAQHCRSRLPPDSQRAPLLRVRWVGRHTPSPPSKV